MIAALSIIIVLTLTVVMTVNSQLKKANQRNLEAMIQTVNMQIEVDYQRLELDRSNFDSPAALVSASVISDKQRQALEDGHARYQLTPAPPKFVLPR
ncbi:hypothetical protein FC34_GL000778 [Lacticaseibacillus brantae DSM 23927]|uniref:Uncharacterized protein n=1 Tax=Lacticaseibacillus brantae DSM 23927 TaxID=1423727 RepID=A0A0R2B0E7_9LACO|nr:hypothetical protein FC34_GL000778 [Lacticaseibacillus brantae DSM 23927]